MGEMGDIGARAVDSGFSLVTTLSRSSSHKIYVIIGVLIVYLAGLELWLMKYEAGG
jgi:hypothetical protein